LKGAEWFNHLHVIVTNLDISESDGFHVREWIVAKEASQPDGTWSLPAYRAAKLLYGFSCGVLGTIANNHKSDPKADECHAQQCSAKTKSKPPMGQTFTSIGHKSRPKS
jgi:hypothetical protein